MVKYSCEKCGKDFTQKGHYTKHTTKKNPCVFESKMEEMIEKVVAKKINELTAKEYNCQNFSSYIPTKKVGIRFWQNLLGC